jgi:hypothetical protein
MKHNKENIHHFKVIVIIFCDDFFEKKPLKGYLSEGQKI